MSFSARSFVFDGIASENYNLVITSDNGESNSPVSDVELSVVKPFRSTKNFLLGVNQTPVLTFPVTLHSLTGSISTDEFSLISQWLFSRQNYLPLQIVQDDMNLVSFNAFFLDPKILRIGNEIVGCSATVTCDSPFGYTPLQINHYTYSSSPSSTIINHFNYSANSGYTMPIVEFTMNSSGGNLSIINITDGNREFKFTGLTVNEVITVDNSLQIITSSLSLLRLSKFNLNFFRLLPGINTLSVTGSIVDLKIKYAYAYKIGG